jgi:HSP20 family protein
MTYTTLKTALDDGVLTLSGSRQAAVEPANVERRRRERAAGRFHRRFTLPDTADAEAVTASGRLGVLEVQIPKRAQAQPRRIAVTQ